MKLTTDLQHCWLALRTLIPRRSFLAPERKRVNAGVAVTIGVLAIATLSTGTAYAYWTSTGTGSGHANTALSRTTTPPVTSTSLDADLLPNTSRNITVTITNPNAFPIIVRAITFGTASATGCTTPAVTYPVAATGLAVIVAANGSNTYTVAGGIRMGDSSSDCQGATLDVPVDLSWTY